MRGLRQVIAYSNGKLPFNKDEYNHLTKCFAALFVGTINQEHGMPRFLNVTMKLIGLFALILIIAGHMAYAAGNNPVL